MANWWLAASMKSFWPTARSTRKSIIPSSRRKKKQKKIRRGADEKARQEQLEAILNVDKDELLEIAKEIDETLEKGGICIIGGKNQIDQCDLDEVISL